jgi:arylsulfatase A-like enzyme
LPQASAGAKLDTMPAPESLPDAIAVITVDRLPAWMLPSYGCAWVATPHIDALVGRGLVLDRALTTTDAVLGTLAGIAGANPNDANASNWPVCAAAIDRGWPSAIVTDDAAFAADLPPEIDVSCRAPFATTEPAAADDATNLAKLFAAVSALVARGSHRLVWCHASSLGMTWDAPPWFRDRYLDPDDPPPSSGATVPSMRIDDQTDPDALVGIRHVFAGQLTLFDQSIGLLLDTIAKRPERWSVLVAGVRGIGLGLHGLVGVESMLPFSEVMQMPVVLVDHAERMAGQRFGGLVTPTDLGATLLSMLGQSSEPSVDPQMGRALTPLLDHWHSTGRDRILMRTQRGIAISTPSWHLIQPTEPALIASQARLFSKPDDFFELCDVADRCPAVAEELATLARGTVDNAWTAPVSSEALDGR